MIATKPSDRFFGINLGAFYRDLKSAWVGMLQWRALSWLWPTKGVRLTLPSGEQVLAIGLLAPVIHDARLCKSAQYAGVVLPETALLRRNLRLPNLRADELSSAVAMDVQAMSPFLLDDCLWVFSSVNGDAGSRSVDVVVTSRKVIAKYLLSLDPATAGVDPEIWVPRASGGGFLTLPGYGNAKRAKSEGLWRWASAFLASVILVLLGCIAATPSAQLYIRSLQAKEAWSRLQASVVPLTAEREALLRNTEQLDRVDKLIGHPTPTLEVLKLITDALPDDTSLTALKIQAHKISMTGQTPNTAALMKHLGSVPGLKDVRAPTPATKPLGVAKELFVIEALVDQSQPGMKP